MNRLTEENLNAEFDRVLMLAMQGEAAELNFYLQGVSAKQLLPGLTKIKKILEGAKVHLFVENGLFRDFGALLELRKIDSLCFGIAEADVAEFENHPEKLKTVKRIYFESGEFIYRSESQSNENYDTLLVLMPAWNNNFAPNGLAHIAASLRQINETCKVIDLNNLFWRRFKNNKDTSENFHNVLLWSRMEFYSTQTRPALEFIFDELRKNIKPQVKYVGFSLFVTNTHASEDAMQLVKSINPAIKTFAGGPSCYDEWARKNMNAGFLDAAIFGEGEAAVQDLITEWRAGTGKPVAGALVKVGDTVISGGERPLLKFENVPLPDFDDFQNYTYDTYDLPIYSSRGCVAKCSFCSETIYWKKFRAQYPETIVKMMETAIRKYGINRFQFNDSLMNGSHQLLEELCDLIIEKNLKVEFYGYMRFDHKLTPELIAKLARAGCQDISFGFESGSQKVVDLMNKKVLVDNYDKILTSAYGAGIKNTVCLIVGFPGETWADFFSTVRKILKVGKYISKLNLSIMEVAPNSLIEKDYEKYGIIIGNGRDWRTKDYTNFYLVRVCRYIIISVLWKLMSGKSVSIYDWSQGYVMFFKKIGYWLSRKISPFLKIRQS